MRRSFLLDTDVAVDLIDARGESLEFLANELAGSRLLVSVITIAELFAGAQPNRVPDKSLIRIEHFLLNSSFEIVPVTPVSAKAAGLLSASLRTSGRSIGIADLLNAAVAIEHGAAIVTRNVRHYSRVPDLAIVTPS